MICRDIHNVLSDIIEAEAEAFCFNMHKSLIVQTIGTNTPQVQTKQYKHDENKLSNLLWHLNGNSVT